MVEITTDEMKRTMIIEMENQIKTTSENQAKRIEAFEELKRRVKPKILVAKRELVAVAKIFTDFHKEHEE